MKILYLMLLFLVSNYGFSLSCFISSYEVKDNKVYYTGFYNGKGEERILLPNADASTFISEDTIGASQSRYGKDKNSVYFEGNILNNIDATTFKILSLHFNTGNSLWGTTCATAAVTYSDKNGVYFENNKLELYY